MSSRIAGSPTDCRQSDRQRKAHRRQTPATCHLPPATHHSIPALSCLLLAALLLLTATSCRHLRPERETTVETVVSESFSRVTEGPLVDRWWETFGSEELNGLVERALEENFSLEQAWARLRQAEAQARQTRSTLRPSLEARADTGARRTEQTTPTAISDSAESYSLGVAAAYELDLWGRLRDSARASGSSLQATRQDVETAAMTLAAQVVETWLQRVEQLEQLALLQEQLDANKTTLDLLERRRSHALATALDVYQQEQVVAQTEALVPAAQGQLDQLNHRLAILLGQPPATDLSLQQASLPEPPGLPALGLPADLLLRRPDLQAARLRLEAADWGVAAARADRLPALRLTGSAAYGAEQLDALFDNWVANLAAGLTGPLLDGGRRRAEVDRTLAVVDERLAAYRQLALEAVTEVEDALAREHSLAGQLKARQRELASARAALAESSRRYRNGLSDYLAVLQSLTAVQRLQRTDVSLRRQWLSEQVSLSRALGGRWTAELGERP